MFKIRNLNVNNYMQQKLLDVTKQTNQHNSILITETSDIKIDKSVNCVMISMVGAGGCGGLPSSKGSFSYGGGGGGAGGGCMKKPIKIRHTPNIDTSIKVVIGQGGTTIQPDGEDTTVYVYNGDTVISKYIAYGGKGAIGKLNKGGEGGEGSADIFQGASGINGSLSGINNTTASVFGGKGGDSIFSKGGLGGNQDTTVIDQSDDFAYPTNKDNPKGLNGNNGSGGGGTAPSENHTEVGHGGNGFAIVEY